jgi:hypothetical protein
MPRYFFHIRNGGKYTRDSKGTYVTDLGSVRRIALFRAKKLLAQKGKAVEDAEFEIADKGGVLVEAVLFSQAKD